MDKFTRQLNLIALLQQAGLPLTFAEIRDRLSDEAYPQRDPESARRGFERDKADLLTMGVPLRSVIATEDPSVTAYTIDARDHAGSQRNAGSPHGTVADPGFTPSELAALRFAATAVALRTKAVDAVTDASEGLRKYGAMGAPPAQRAVADLQLDDNVSDLFGAILDVAPVGFTYAGRTRRVLPVQLANRGGHWYLRSEDLEMGEYRTYRLDRFESPVLRIPDESPDVTPREPPHMGGLGLRPWEFGDSEPVRVLVALDPPAAAVATAGDPDLEVLRVDPTGSTIALSVRNPDGLWPWMLSFLERAVLLEPPEMREAYLLHLRSIAADPAPDTGAGS